jgi:hypothetical protein
MRYPAPTLRQTSRSTTVSAAHSCDEEDNVSDAFGTAQIVTSGIAGLSLLVSAGNTWWTIRKERVRLTVVGRPREDFDENSGFYDWLEVKVINDSRSDRKIEIEQIGLMLKEDGRVFQADPPHVRTERTEGVWILARDQSLSGTWDAEELGGQFHDRTVDIAYPFVIDGRLKTHKGKWIRDSWWTRAKRKRAARQTAARRKSRRQRSSPS